MNANNRDDVGEAAESTGPATAVTVPKELFVGIDTSRIKQVVTRLRPGERPNPAEAMGTETLLARVGRWVKEGYRVHCVSEAGPTGFGLQRAIVSAGATCLVVRPKRL